MKDSYKYEVAFSFVEKDVELALQIADRIGDRLRTFVYPERPEEFVSADGMDAHHRIYEDEALVVAVLYREGWGQTSWTRVEEQAIKNRVSEEGHNFYTVIPLDDSALPQWLPPTRIRFGLERYGIDGVTSVITAAVQAQGGGSAL